MNTPILSLLCLLNCYHGSLWKLPPLPPFSTPNRNRSATGNLLDTDHYLIWTYAHASSPWRGRLGLVYPILTQRTQHGVAWNKQIMNVCWMHGQTVCSLSFATANVIPWLFLIQISQEWNGFSFPSSLCRYSNLSEQKAKETPVLQTAAQSQGQFRSCFSCLSFHVF